MSDRLPSSPLPVSAHPSPHNGVTYIYKDGSMITLHGDRPYRSNNPGNLRFPGSSGRARAQRAGAVGLDGTFAVFPNVAAGEKAIAAMIDSNGSQSLSAFLHRYAPPGENNTMQYITVVKTALKASDTDLLSSLTATQRSLLMQTIMIQEGGTSHGHEFAPPTFSKPKTGR